MTQDESWITSPAHAALLAKFGSPRDPYDVALGHRVPNLGEPAPTAVERFVDQGYIHPSTLEEKLGALNTTELKDALRASGLKASGRKDDLVDRLAKGAPGTAQECVKGTPHTYALSATGRKLVDSYIAWERHRIETAISDVRAALVF